MRVTIRRPSIGVRFAGLCLALACGSSDSTGGHTPTGPATITVRPNPASVAKGSTLQLQATVKDSNGLTLSGVALIWSTSNPGVAGVSTTGLVSGMNQGTATITAAAGTIDGSATVTVTTTPPAGLHVLSSSYLGGSDEDMARDAAIDAQGNVVVVGNTKSSDFPTTAGSYDPTYNTGGSPTADAFAVKYAPDGTRLWSTYVGGPNYERAYAVEVDGQGNVIMAGRAGQGLPVTAGAFQTTFGGGPTSSAYGTQDGFVCKLNPGGTARIFCSYFGTADLGIIRDVAVDVSGDIYVAAGSTVGGFPSAWFTNAYQPNHAAGDDIIVAKIKSDGSQVLWATYLGGSGNEGGNPSIRVDGSKNVYVLVSTSSSDLQVTAGGRPFKANTDMYVAKLSPDGSTLLYGTYLGGSGNEDSETHGLAVNSGGEAYVTAFTSSSDFPTTQGSLQPVMGDNPGSGLGDAFIAHLSTTGVLLQATYYGGTDADGSEGIAVDGQGNVYVGVRSRSPAAQLPQTQTLGPLGLADAIILKLNSTLSQRLYSARLGGASLDGARGVAVDATGSAVYLVGEAESPDFPEVNAQQAGFGGGIRDGIFVRIGP